MCWWQKTLGNGSCLRIYLLLLSGFNVLLVLVFVVDFCNCCCCCLFIVFIIVVTFVVVVFIVYYCCYCFCYYYCLFLQCAIEYCKTNDLFAKQQTQRRYVFLLPPNPLTAHTRFRRKATQLGIHSYTHIFSKFFLLFTPACRVFLIPSS